jgi:hypothetical protein
LIISALKLRAAWRAGSPYHVHQGINIGNNQCREPPRAKAACLGRK